MALKELFGTGSIIVLYKDELNRFCEIHCKSIIPNKNKLTFYDDADTCIKDHSGKDINIKLSQIIHRIEYIK